jgi:hypothetical protein
MMIESANGPKAAKSASRAELAASIAKNSAPIAATPTALAICDVA